MGEGQWLVHNCETIDPAKVRFTQDSIKDGFKDGKGLDDTIAGLKNGTIDPSTIPPIRIYEKDGKLYSLDNRRLYAFKQAGVEVPYRMATPEEVAKEGWKFTTKDDGASIIVRKPK